MVHEKVVLWDESKADWKAHLRAVSTAGAKENCSAKHLVALKARQMAERLDFRKAARSVVESVSNWVEQRALCSVGLWVAEKALPMVELMAAK